MTLNFDVRLMQHWKIPHRRRNMAMINA